MIQKIIVKKILPLIAAAGMGLLAVWLFQPQITTPQSDEVESPQTSVTTPLKITAKPRAQYTDEARHNNVQGVVRLRITLLANGEIGSITPISELPFGLTEQAIAAARQIKFEPRKVNGVAQSSIATFEYSFTIY